ncbi:MAG: hypothetical protein ACLTSD_06180 [Eubacterium sp.]|jgi:type III secretory pathway lipoprotein EscJ|nr:hypothetical protein [Roseburia sp.]
MTKIYNANTFLEADQIIATLQSQHISAEKREISDMNVITGKMETAFEIYVSEEDAENAVKCIEQMSISDTDTSGRSRAARIYAIAALGIIAVMICLSLVL